MRCLYCGCVDSKVIDSRPTEEGLAIRRRRECLNCGKRFTTYEKIEYVPVAVIKKDGRREPFDVEKIIQSIQKSVGKLPISTETVDKIANDIEVDIQNSLVQEVSTTQIGEMVMEKLKSLNDVAYVRFASVYRQFKDIESFKQQLEELLDNK